jgi:hypothetical protein
MNSLKTRRYGDRSFAFYFGANPATDGNFKIGSSQLELGLVGYEQDVLRYR